MNTPKGYFEKLIKKYSVRMACSKCFHEGKTTKKGGYPSHSLDVWKRCNGFATDNGSHYIDESEDEE